MADNDKILFKDLFDLADIEKGLTNLEKRISDTKKSIKTDAGGVGGNLSNTTVGSGTDYQKLVNEIKKAQTTLESFIKTQKQEKEVNEQLLETKKKQIEIQAQLALSKREDAQALKSRIGELQAEKMATEGGTKSLIEMKQELRALTSISLRGKKPEEIKEIQTQIGVLRNDIKDLNQQMKLMDKGEILGGWIKIGQGVVGAFGAATAALNLFGSENKTVQEIERKSMALIQLMMGLEQTRQLLIDQGGIKNLKTLWATTQAHLAETLMIKGKTVATTENTAAETVNTATKAKGGIVTKSITALQWLWNAAVSANPIMAMVIAVAALVVGIAALAGAFNKSTAAAKAAIDVNKKFSEIAAKPIADFEILVNKLKSTTIGTQKHRDAVDEYNKIQKECNGTLLTYNSTLDEINKTTDNARIKLLEKLDLQAKEALMSDIISQRTELILKKEQDRIRLTAEFGASNKNLQTVLKENAKIWDEQINALNTEIGAILNLKTDYSNLASQIDNAGKTMKDYDFGAPFLPQSTGNEYNILLKNVADNTENINKHGKKGNTIHKEKINLLEYINKLMEEANELADTNYKAEQDIAYKEKQQHIETLDFYTKEKALKDELDEMDMNTFSERQKQIDAYKASFNDLKFDEQLDVIVNGKYTKASQEMGDAIVEMMQRIADEKMKKAESDLKGHDQDVLFHEENLKMLDEQLKKEQEKAARGIANNASLIKNQIATEKALQDLDKQKQAVARKQMEKAFEEKKKADKAATRIDYFKELGSIATTAASLGFPYGIIYGVLMAGLATVNFSKRMQAINAETLKFASGGRGIVRGRRHSEGGEKVAGVGEVEDGEAFSVFSRDATKRNKKEIFDFTDAVNSGRLNEQLNKWALYKNLNIPMIITTDFKKMEEKQDVMISEQKKANSLLMLLGDRVSADGKTIIKANGTIIKMI